MSLSFAALISASAEVSLERLGEPSLSVRTTVGIWNGRASNSGLIILLLLAQQIVEAEDIVSGLILVR